MYRATGRIIGLVLVTLCAVAVMITFGAGRWFWRESNDSQNGPTVAESKASVIVKTMRREPIMVVDVYSGTIEPLEKYSLGFQIAGRLEMLGKNDLGQSLDEGDEVICRRPPPETVAAIVPRNDRRSQLLKDLTPALAPEGFLVSTLLAQLDSELLRVQRDELMVQLEQAHYDFEKAQALRQRRAITDTEYQSRRTDFSTARLRYRAADRKLRDSQLRLVVPDRGTRDASAEPDVANGPLRRFIVSKRLAVPGETLSAQQTVFELIEVDRVKLVVGVPESKVRELDLRMRDMAENRRRARAGVAVDPNDLHLSVDVRLLGKKRFGEAWPALQGYVHQLSQTAGTNGLFDVEIIIDNPDGTLRPGLFAVADIVVERIDGFRLPRSAVRYDQDGTAYLFSVHQDTENGNVTATRYDLKKLEEQGGDVILRDLPVQHQTIVVRGQHRLTPGRLVEIIQVEQAPGDPVVAEVIESIHVPTLGSRP